jgi:hypothetical protein
MPRSRAGLDCCQDDAVCGAEDAGNPVVPIALGASHEEISLLHGILLFAWVEVNYCFVSRNALFANPLFCCSLYGVDRTTLCMLHIDPTKLSDYA